jgi:hypothetical protein
MTLENRRELIYSTTVHLEDHTVEGWCDASLLQIPDTSEDIRYRISRPHTWLVWIIPRERGEDIIEYARCSYTIYRPGVSVFSEEISVASEYLITEAMERMDCHTIGIRTDHTSKTISHIASSVVCECETEDIGWEIVGTREDIGYPRSEDLSLATSRSGDHEYWSVDRLDCFSLSGIEGCEYILY